MKILNWILLFGTFSWSVSAQNDPLWKLYYDSTQFYWNKDWNKTVRLLENAERSAIADLGNYHENYLTILNDLGTAYWKARHYEKAEKLLTTSLSLKKEIYAAENKEVILSMSNLAGFYAEQGQWARSKALYKAIISLNPAHIPPVIYVSAAQSLVSLYDMNQQPDSARLLLGLIDKWNITPPNTYLDFQHQFYQARLHRKKRDYSAAESLLEELVSNLDNRSEPELGELYIRCLQEEGILFLQTGRYSQAEKRLLQAYRLTTAEQTNYGYLTTELSNHLAQVYDKLNISDKALAYYRESLAYCKSSYDEDALPCVILQNNIAGIHLADDNISQAISNYLRVIDSFENLLQPSDPLYITAINNLATAYRKNDQLRLAAEYLSKAEKLLKENGLNNDDVAAAVYNNIATINAASGDYQAAADYYKMAYEIKRRIYGEHSVVLLDLISNLAVTYWALNRYEEGIPLFKQSMALATKQVVYVFPNLNEHEQVQFYQKLKEDFERFNTIAIQWSEYDDELISLMFQNRTIIKSLQFFTDQRRRNKIAMMNDSSLNNLVSRLKSRRSALGHLYQLPLRELKKGGAAVALLEKEIDQLEKILSTKTNEAYYDNGLAPEEISWQSLSQRLSEKEAIVEMVRFRKYDRQTSRKKALFGFTDSVYYASLIITRECKQRPALVLLKRGNDLEGRYYNYYKNSMRYGLEDDLSYHFFWKPLEKELADKTTIYLSSDGVYHKINVNTLRDPQTDQYLLEKLDVVYLLNPIQFLEHEASGDQNKRSAVLMGDPVFDIDPDTPRERGVGFGQFTSLPGTQEELRAIDKVLKAHSWKTTMYLKGAATERNLKSVHSPAFLHIASHGFFSSDIVSLNSKAKKEFLFHSGIVLSGANKSLSVGSTSFQNDGIVTAFEVMNLDLTGTRLVVLSACETGLGKIENGEGVFGLQRSFMQAGARNVLISLWKVNDDLTKDLMIKFYQYLALGNSLHHSLKQAQLDQSKLVSNPAHWGAFVLVGDN